MTGAAHATKVDRSPDTGSLVVCTCGLALGPYVEHEKALRAAKEHRTAVAVKPEKTEEQRAADRARANAYNAALRERRRLRREAEAST